MKVVSDRQEALLNKMVEEDDTLMAVYPKIKGVPDFRKKEVYRRDLSKILTENRDHDQARKELTKQSNAQEKDEFMHEATRLAKLEEEEKELHRKDLLLRNLDTQKAQIQNMVQKELQKKIRVDADKLEHKIVHTFP